MCKTNQTKLCYSVSVEIGLGDDLQILHNKKYTTLREVAKELSLPYQQVTDISIGRSKRFKTSFKYQPRITIQKLSNIVDNGITEINQDKEAKKEVGEG